MWTNESWKEGGTERSQVKKGTGKRSLLQRTGEANGLQWVESQPRTLKGYHYQVWCYLVFVWSSL